MGEEAIRRTRPRSGRGARRGGHAGGPAAGVSPGRPAPGPSTAAGRVLPGRGPLPPGGVNRPSRPWTRCVVEVGCGMGRGRDERQPVVERPALHGPRRSNRGGRNPSVSGSGPMTRLIDASATGARKGPGGGGGYPEDAAAFCPGGQEGRARRRTGGGSLSRRGRMVQRTATAGPRGRSSLRGETPPPIETPHGGGRAGRSEGRAERGQGGASVVAGATLK